jgi:hypothetical protein
MKKMKKQFWKIVTAVCMLLVFLVSNSFAQTTAKATKNEKQCKKVDKAKVPKVITESFYVDYPVTMYENWYNYPLFDDNLYWYDYDPYYYESENPDYYVVDFTMHDIPYKAVYSKKGKKISVHKKITDLPKAVSSALSSGEYKTWTVAKDKEEIFKDKDSDQLKVYKVCVENGKEKHSLYFQPDGKLLKDKTCTK